jgi:single-strand DNA-binding protein
MFSVNEVWLVGNLGKDPEIRHTQSGQQVATISLCTNRSIKNQEGQWHTEATWHSVVCWQKQAEIIGSAQKGDGVAIQGRLQYREWEDKDGNKRNTTEIVAFSCWKLAPAAKPKEAKQEKPAQQRDHQPPPPEDDIPF